MKKQHVVVVGGGFGGIKSALELSGHPSFQVTLIADKPFFEYYPMMYRTATGGSKIVSSMPLGDVFVGKRIEIIIDKAKKLHRNSKSLTLASGAKIDYDILILSLGNVTNYFGIPGLSEFSYGIKSLHDTEKLKAHLHKQFISARKPDQHYIIIGGGPTGVELAGALPDYLKYLMKQHGVKGKPKIHIDLIEASPRLMPRMPKRVSKALAKRLRSLGVTLYFGKPVQAETADHLLLDGKEITSHTVIWTAGMSNNPFYSENNFQINQNGRVQVDQLLQAWPGVFVIGDNADTPYTGMAQTALHDACYVTKNLKRYAEGHNPYAYEPRKPVYVTPAGKNWAVVVWGKIYFYGYTGWIFRRAADWIGYRDVEPWWKATERFLKEDNQEDNCLVCATKVRSVE